jgi:pyrimidine-nucleoside phosphorylase
VTAYEVILKKRDGGHLLREEIEFMIKGFVTGSIPDYQMAAFLMAVYFRGMERDELGFLTMCMVDSGETVDLSFVTGRKIDKHSSGGVGDKTSLVVCPLVAACGVPVAKMSGRGLGHTGGTLDKLEAIPGFRVTLDPAELHNAIEQAGLYIVSQSARLVPADSLMYSLRDVIAAVDSIPLIASSIMSKKIAGGADAIVLDVKVGAGAFMKTDAGALELARTMISIGEEVGRETVALITGMSEPLGLAVGNALEVAEAISTLKGMGPVDFTQLCLAVASEMVALGRRISVPAAREMCESALSSGKALDRFERMISMQGGDVRVIEHPDLWLPRAPEIREISAATSGYVQSIDALKVGMACSHLGAGRKRKGEPVDPSVGVVFKKKTGDWAQMGETLFTIHARNPGDVDEAASQIASGIAIAAQKPSMLPVVRHRIDAAGAVSFDT